LSFVEELRSGAITDSQLMARPDVIGAFRSRAVPWLSTRVLQRLAMKAGLLDFERGFLSQVHRARGAMLGSRADAPPRFLVRVDEYPDSAALDDSPQRWRDATKVFHETLCAAGVPYLMAVVPQYTHRPLDPAAAGGRPLGDEDHALLELMAGDGVTFAQHGTTHRTRYSSPRRRSELCGLDAAATDALIGAGRRQLAELGVETRVFVPPFNRFDAAQFTALGRCYDIIAGGPESVSLVGFQGGPIASGNAVYLPCYEPLYAQASRLVPVVDRLVARGIGTWVPIVLHVSWEMPDRFRALDAFAQKVAPYAVSWNLLLDAVDLTRASDGAQPAAESTPS